MDAGNHKHAILTACVTREEKKTLFSSVFQKYWQMNLFALGSPHPHPPPRVIPDAAIAINGTNQADFQVERGHFQGDRYGGDEVRGTESLLY